MLEATVPMCRQTLPDKGNWATKVPMELSTMNYVLLTPDEVDRRASIAYFDAHVDDKRRHDAYYKSQRRDLLVDQPGFGSVAELEAHLKHVCGGGWAMCWKVPRIENDVNRDRAIWKVQGHCLRRGCRECKPWLWLTLDQEGQKIRTRALTRENKGRWLPKVRDWRYRELKRVNPVPHVRVCLLALRTREDMRNTYAKLYIKNDEVLSLDMRLHEVHADVTYNRTPEQHPEATTFRLPLPSHFTNVKTMFEELQMTEMIMWLVPLHVPDTFKGHWGVCESFSPVLHAGMASFLQQENSAMGPCGMSTKISLLESYSTHIWEGVPAYLRINVWEYAAGSTPVEYETNVLLGQATTSSQGIFRNCKVKPNEVIKMFEDFRIHDLEVNELGPEG